MVKYVLTSEEKGKIELFGDGINDIKLFDSVDEVLECYEKLAIAEKELFGNLVTKYGVLRVELNTDKIQEIKPKHELDSYIQDGVVYIRGAYEDSDKVSKYVDLMLDTLNTIYDLVAKDTTFVKNSEADCCVYAINFGAPNDDVKSAVQKFHESYTEVVKNKQ